ncbi:MAG: sigma-70 family RNA polymerase sigma factor [Ignavibacteriae bacterium]|nr:sigma-70 family RNA polymerase sigma factor [Ignavibacteria bacterium]MBI3363798.1 sigma-70 family RNA polymerase sigma factor [Ignavibacteriota bacterium]
MPQRKSQKAPRNLPHQHIPDSATAIRRPPQSSGKVESRKEDARLIHAALDGNQAAYKHLMKKYHDAIYNLIYRIVHERGQVEDLTQEVFVKAFASLKNFNEEYAFSTWLYKIATNSSIDYIRKRKLETFSIDKPIAMEESDYHFELPDTTYQPDKSIIQKQRTTLIEEAINKLPEKYKRVITLRHTEERDYAEIAKILKLPIGTVKAHIFRARELLNKYLRDKISHY